MRTIWKIILTPANWQTVSLPEGYKILSVQMQRDNICMWCEVDPGEKEVQFTVFIYATGDPVGTNLHYIGTVQDGDLVWHVYKIRSDV